MQACLARLYVDGSFRRLFELDPGTTISGYILTADEQNALKGIDMRMLQFFAVSLINKRKEYIVSAYPLLYRLKPTLVDHYFERYSQICISNPYQANSESTIQFGRFFEESTASADDVPTYISEIAKYERVVYSMKIGFATPEVHTEPTPLLTPEDRPILRPGVCIEVFSCDVNALADEIERGTSPKELVPRVGEFRLLVIPPDRMGAGGRVMRINDATNVLLDLCDGARNLTQITAQIERVFNLTKLDEQIRESVEHLFCARAIQLMRSSP